MQRGGALALAQVAQQVCGSQGGVQPFAQAGVLAAGAAQVDQQACGYLLLAGQQAQQQVDVARIAQVGLDGAW
ncbi:hypothetical protein Q1Z72_12965 [Pseudomonas qingdaonensis]|uniref:hypothetical protein n=1 Tax=Pseudomonas qingdaonensis TaxID=2056231 RepID=UPI00265E15B2|nr:hypothetical protein [Pseudomonas qingdaonensis]WKL69517.1 hypothetical protein Q1Z72_12965 [Pseudomonas qingdaonensis]